MKLVTFSRQDRISIGKVLGNRVIDLPASDPALPADMRTFLAGGQPLLRRAREVGEDAVSYALADVRLEAPVPDASKFLALGIDGIGHIENVVIPEPA